MRVKKIFIFSFVFILLAIFLSEKTAAHCPLCTIGAAAAASGAVWLGISKIVVSVFIGAFAISMGMWFSNILKKKYIKFQKAIIIILVFVTTILPILPFITSEHNYYPLYISFSGEYGSLFNRTYLINYSLIGSMFGGAIVFVSPLLSKHISKLRRGKTIPFQGIILTFILLIIAGGIIQFLT